MDEMHPSHSANYKPSIRVRHADAVWSRSRLTFVGSPAAMELSRRPGLAEDFLKSSVKLSYPIKLVFKSYPAWPLI